MKTIIKVLIIGAIFFQYGCSLKWAEAIQYGEVEKIEFHEVVAIEVTNGVIIVPVVINGETYRFLFDSGAPFSISKKLQNKLQYKIITHGRIVDSDHNKTKVNYVEVDSVFIQGIAFKHQTAFVGDFESNPIIKCLNIDGIIGSNLMRYCNWKVDYQDKEITLFSSFNGVNPNAGDTIPFHPDNQYNLKVDLEMGSYIIKNMRIDYGSNGSISLPQKAFNTLKKNKTIGKTFPETGVTQAGLIGKPISINRETTYSDSAILHHLKIEDVKIVSGGSKLIGGKILSRYIVTIDWDHQQLYFKDADSVIVNHKTFGIRIGYSNDKKLYIQSVIEGSSAFEKGVKPNMQVLKMDNIDFSQNIDFCSYMDYFMAVSDSIRLELSGTDGKRKEVLLEKRVLGKQ